MSARLTVQNLTKRFGRTVAVDGVSFEIAPGEILGVVGPSGSGKSTLLNIAGGMIKPEAGEVTLDDEPVIAPGPQRAMVFQDHGLFPWMTVTKNVEFNMKARGVSAAERAKRARGFIAMTSLMGFEYRYPHELSGGMRQRVGIARALTTDPKALLMDEPFGALDAQTRGNLQDELLQIWQQERKTVLFVTHDLHEALRLGSRIALLEAGKLVSIGSPEEFLSSSDPLVKKYVEAFGSIEEARGRK